MADTLFACGAYSQKEPLPLSLPCFPSPPITYHAHNDSYFDTNGCPFRQLFQEFPALSPFYADFEKNFNAWSYTNWAERNMWLAWVICAGYLAFLYVGGKCMENRERFVLKKPLAAWNLALAIFSAIGFLRTAPHLLYYLVTEGFYSSVCKPGESSTGQGAVGMWVLLFVASKIPELIDTVFITLRKSSLIFLHWYHHVTVLLFCWHSYATRSSTGLYFVAMNFGVHALMYFYYFLSSIGIKVKWDKIVTTLQISQMFVGMFICGAVYYFETMSGKFCDVRADNYLAGLVMYASYAALFIIFALERYFTGKSSLAPASRRPVAAKAEVESKEATVPAPAAAVVNESKTTETDPQPVAEKSSSVRQRKARVHA